MDIPVITVPSSEVPVFMGGDTTALEAELDKDEARVVDMESVENNSVCSEEELLFVRKKNFWTKLNNLFARRSTIEKKPLTRMRIV